MFSLWSVFIFSFIPSSILVFSQEQLLGGGDHSEVVTYSVEVSLPRYFTLPSTVKMPVKEDTHKPWDHPAGTHTNTNAQRKTDTLILSAPTFDSMSY